VAAFFDRLEALLPDMAIFLEDTKLRMPDKLVKMFELEIARRLSPDPPVLERVEGEIFTIRKRVFLANTAPDLVRAIGICLEMRACRTACRWEEGRLARTRMS
jgi:hypothetical protein